MTTTTACPDCTAAEADHHHGGYRADCLECSARALAHAPEGWRAARCLTNAPLREAILKLAERHQVMASVIQKRVWHWIARIHNLNPSKDA